MRQAGTVELFSYWNELRGTRAAPERADLDLVAMRNVLADTFMLEVTPARIYPFCLSGTRLSALFDVELKGRSFLSFWDATQRQDIVSVLETVIEGVSPIVAGVAGAPPDYDQIDFELLLLPLRHYGKTHARVLGRLAPAKRPSWLGLLPVTALNFMSMRVLETPVNANPAVSHSRSPSMSPPDHFAKEKSFASFEQRGHLRVYPGNA